MARTPKTVKPVITDAERAALAQLLYGSSLFAAHGVIVTNIRQGIAQLLITLGRPDLVDVWGDDEALAATFSRTENGDRGTQPQI